MLDYEFLYAVFFNPNCQDYFNNDDALIVDQGHIIIDHTIWN